jgi:signal transduction histidine kinase
MDFTRNSGNCIKPMTRKTRRPDTKNIHTDAELGWRKAVSVIRRQYPFILTLGALIILVEGSRYLLANYYGAQSTGWFNLVAYIILLPSGMIGLLVFLDRKESERLIAAQEGDQRAEFSQKLCDARDMDELVSCLVEFPHQVAPLANATLFIYNVNKERLEPEATCGRDGTINLRPDDTVPAAHQTFNPMKQPFLQNGSGLNRYDMPLLRAGQMIGSLKLEYPPGISPTAEEVRALKMAMPLMSLALESELMLKRAREEAVANDTQRQQIAQHLHDTLAQNIGYLRLKLDQLTGQNAILEIGMVLEELERMRATADEAYQQVRSTLDELNPMQNEDLTMLMIKQAQTICDRAGLCLRQHQTGATYLLPPSVHQQVLYIVREALHNIEKHARATHVSMHVHWLEQELLIKIADDGIGFDPFSIKSQNSSNQDVGHYGLWIMQHRAQEVGGTLRIAQSDEHGTEITLSVPRTIAPV